MGAAPDLVTNATSEPAGGVPAVAPRSGPVPACVDFAILISSRLLIHGWILDSAKSVVGAFIRIGQFEIDLLTVARRIPRPDVAVHFKSEAGDVDHGFYALVELRDLVGLPSELELSIITLSGIKQTSLWPVAAHPSPSEEVFAPYIETVKTLVPYLSRVDLRALQEFLSLPASNALGIHLIDFLPLLVQFRVDFCGVLGNNSLLILGTIADPAEQIQSIDVRVGGAAFDLTKYLIFHPRSGNVSRTLPRGPQGVSEECGFFAALELGDLDSMSGEAQFIFHFVDGEAAHQRQAVSWDWQDSMQELISSLHRAGPDKAFPIAEQLQAHASAISGLSSFSRLMLLQQKALVKSLPHFIEDFESGISIRIDLTIPVAGEGIFLSGWLYAEDADRITVDYRNGDAGYSISDNWIRHTRADVVSYLAERGIRGNDPQFGFSCYVPFHPGSRPAYLSIGSDSEPARRLRIDVPERTEDALLSVRRVLNSFSCENRNLRGLMERQIGPAVSAIWASRRKPTRKQFVRSFGAPAPNPSLSAIVPLYGRFDLAEYQLAHFANDPEIQQVDLIYVVDDPAIVDEFLFACPTFYELYRVPFTVLSSGTNLGYAAANNAGAEIARAQRILLLNSDVLPKRRGWAGELLRAFDRLSNPGLLGVKLVYEDGSLQHAGMAYRRYQPWGDLWINTHPCKGLNPDAVSGVREVDAVTAACALIETETYRRLGGFSEDYIIGDFEDSDLCIRAHLEGKRNYVDLDTELYHLERQSQNKIGDARLRTNLTLYNCWRFNSRWSATLDKLGAGKKEE